ncbi:hypothetical protein JCM8097_000906 [Rhodosporidiobolus ruineniae]
MAPPSVPPVYRRLPLRLFLTALVAVLGIVASRFFRLSLSGRLSKPVSGLTAPVSTAASAAVARRSMSTTPSASPSSPNPHPMRPPLVFPPPSPSAAASSEKRATVIWSHGLGDSAEGWRDFVEAVRGKWAREGRGEGVGWVVTNAYDIPVPAAPPALEDAQGMLASAGEIRSLIEAEVKNGVDPKRIVLGGFSQGAVLSLLTGLTHPEALGGICALSGFLGLTHEDRIKELTSPASAQTPIVWAHGTSDPMIRFSRALAGRSYLTDKLERKEGEAGGFEFKAYEGLEHSLGREEFGDVVEWLERVLEV